MIALLAIAILSILLFILFNNRKFDYWKKKGIPHLNPQFIFGDIIDLVFQRISVAEYFIDIYQQTKKHLLIGLYFSYRGVILITNADLARTILTRDFHFFTDRGVLSDETVDPLVENLFCITGEKWKNLRRKLTPLFSSAKLKGMFPIILDVVKTLERHIESRCYTGFLMDRVIDVRNLSGKFTISLISSIAFGVKNDAINDSENDFYVAAMKVLEPEFINNMKLMMGFFTPELNKIFNIRMIAKDAEEFFTDVVRQTIDYREKNDVNRSDFIQLLIQCMKDDDNDANLSKLSLNEVVANSFLFVMAGYETTASTITYCLYEIAKNEEVQEKINREIDEVLKGEFTYDKINELKYLESCIQETLRKYPILPMLNRVTLRDYKVEDTNYTIPKGTPVIIPLIGFQRDEDLIEDPMKFNPERNVRNDAMVAPFGLGQRTCIGTRMAMVVIKLCLSYIISKYSMELVYPLEELNFSTKVPTLTPDQTIVIKFDSKE